MPGTVRGTARNSGLWICKTPEICQGPPEVAALVCTKEPYRTSNLHRKIQKITFGLMSPAELVSTSDILVHERAMYSMPEKTPAPNSVLDPRLGVSRKHAICQTCNQKLEECTGHFGYVKLQLPVFHIGYFKITLKTLQCICKSCSRVLLSQDERLKHLRQFRSEQTDRVRRDALFNSIVKRCRQQRQCPHCGEANGPVKKVTGSLKIVHDKYAKNHEEYVSYTDQFKAAISMNEHIEPHIRKVADDLNPIRVLALFSAVPKEDCELLDLAGRPEDLVMTVVPVPPVCIRPSVDVDGGGGTNEDDITVKLTMIIDSNNNVRTALEKGMKMEMLMEQWDHLQTQCAMYINSDLPGLPSQTYQSGGKPVKGFVQRLKGKQGRFRGNLSGKRVDFTGRTVISPDPNLRVDEVAVPKQVATILTYPERVTPHNIERLRKCILNGMTQWPGANLLVYPNGSKTSLKFGDRRRVAQDLKVGDLVERHLQNGDIVLFNRQPSLHRMSIMAHRVRVMPWRTLRFNECVCSPYNADFDGDEMNLHVPQTEEARAEALHLMGVMDNLCTPKNGEILIAATQDFLTSAYLLTSKDKFYSRAEIGRLCAFMGDATHMIDLPGPALVKPLELWTGKQVFSMLIRPNASTKVFVNLETSEKIYKGSEHLCPMDGYVCFRNSELICGRLGKATLGGGNKSGLFQVLTTDFSARAAAAVMNRLAKLSARFIGEQGFSIGIDDVTPALRLRQRKEATVSDSYGQCDSLISQYQAGKLELQKGCNLEESLEAEVTGVLNGIRESVSKVCMSTLHWHNSPLIMSQCGSKGSPINIAQMVACVGQQSVSGKRCPNGFKDRTLPHFPRGDKTPAGKGFVENSFYSGLTPTEFFFHTMAGREGLVDTAVKTAETGYMSRRLMKALEDLYTHYDGTVRNAASVVVQPDYGDDGMDPVCMEGKAGEPVDLQRALAIARAVTPKAMAGLAPLPGQLSALVEEELAAIDRMPASNGQAMFCTKAFRDSLHDYLSKQIEEWRKLRMKLELPLNARGDERVESAASMLSLNEAQVRNFVRLCAKRYDSKRMDPGSTVGAFGAQSIGEPGTQMTLKTFHFAGVASMNVTLGVPRIREIINASKKISTPIMNVVLEVQNSEASARIVKARLERTSLGQVAQSINVVLQPNAAFILIDLDMKAIAALQLGVTAVSVAESIAATPKLKLKDKDGQNICAVGDSQVEVHPPRDAKQPLFFMLQTLLQQLPRVIVQGISSVERAVINQDKDKKYNVLVEGLDLRSVMGTVGVVGTQTTTNHVMELAEVLGIEAARSAIMSEIQYTMGQHGMSIDTRHTMLLADCMTFKGEVLGITRFGIAKMKDSVLNLASFEKTTDHLFDAALHGRTDYITGVSESIIMGIPMPTGTGLFKLRHATKAVIPAARPPTLLSY